MGSTKTKTTSNGTATTTPNIYEPAIVPTNSLLAGVNNYLQTDPQQWVTGPNPLQVGAFSNGAETSQAGLNTLNQAASTGSQAPRV